jgi:hypothetical protein
MKISRRSFVGSIALALGMPSAIFAKEQTIPKSGYFSLPYVPIMGTPREYANVVCKCCDHKYDIELESVGTGGQCPNCKYPNANKSHFKIEKSLNTEEYIFSLNPKLEQANRKFLNAMLNYHREEDGSIQFYSLGINTETNPEAFYVASHYEVHFYIEDLEKGEDAYDQIKDFLFLNKTNQWGDPWGKVGKLILYKDEYFEPTS